MKKREKNVMRVSLLDLLQIIPDFCRNLKHLSTRVGDKAQKTARRYANMRGTTVYVYISNH